MRRLPSEVVEALTKEDDQVIQIEAHSLRIGQHFAFDPKDPPLALVEGSIIESCGDVVMLYHLNGALYAHLSDHTPVWIE